MAKTASNYKRKIIYEKLSGMCCYCGEKLDFNNFHIEHLVPKSQGGKNDMENLFPACCLCNLTKGPLNVEEYREKIASLGKENISVQLFLKHYQYAIKPVVFYFEKVGV